MPSRLPNPGRASGLVLRIVVAVNEDGRRIGETHHNARIPDVIVDQLRDLHEDFLWPYWRIARDYKLSIPTVKKICTYQRRAQTPERWKRLETATR
jgi:hypothetical protein